jgi:hypothetical protein
MLLPYHGSVYDAMMKVYRNFFFTLLKSIIFFYKLMQNLPFVNIDLLTLKTVMSIF